MKLKRNIGAVAVALSLVAGVAFAANGGNGMIGSGGGPGYGMMYGQGPHSGQYKQGRGMRGWGCACFIDGYGPGMGKRGGMGPGFGRGRGAGVNDPALFEKRNRFLDATVELRKKIHEKKFSYREACRNPAITLGELQTREKELLTMRQQLQTERQKFFTAEQ